MISTRLVCWNLSAHLRRAERDFSVDLTAALMTAGLALVYFGSRKVLKNGISPIALIGLSAIAGIAVYGL